ncbi:MAG: hypothetical protein ABI760_08870 [Ferruginibacter sp.]
MKKTIFPIITVLFLILVSANGCYNDNKELLYGSQNTDCSTVQAKFGTDIITIITGKCAISGCHDANAAANPAGITLQSYLQVSANKDRINMRVVLEKTMPPTGPLTPAETGKIQCWLANGAQNN